MSPPRDDTDHRRPRCASVAAPGTPAASNSGAKASAGRRTAGQRHRAGNTPNSGCTPRRPRSARRRRSANTASTVASSKEQEDLRPADSQQRQARAEADGREERNHHRRLQRVSNVDRQSRRAIVAQHHAAATSSPPMTGAGMLYARAAGTPADAVADEQDRRRRKATVYDSRSHDMGMYTFASGAQRSAGSA